jgi:hypothetical protein
MLGQRGGTLNNNRTRFENLTLAAIHQLVLSFLSKEWGDPQKDKIPSLDIFISRRKTKFHRVRFLSSRTVL